MQVEWARGAALESLQNYPESGDPPRIMWSPRQLPAVVLPKLASSSSVPARVAIAADKSVLHQLASHEIDALVHDSDPKVRLAFADWYSPVPSPEETVSGLSLYPQYMQDYVNDADPRVAYAAVKGMPFEPAAMEAISSVRDAERLRVIHMAVEGWLEHYGVHASREMLERAKGRRTNLTYGPYIPTLMTSELPSAASRIKYPLSAVRKVQAAISKRIVALGGVAPEPLPDDDATGWARTRIGTSIRNGGGRPRRGRGAAEVLASDRERLRGALSESNFDFEWGIKLFNTGVSQGALANWGRVARSHVQSRHRRQWAIGGADKGERELTQCLES